MWSKIKNRKVKERCYRSRSHHQAERSRDQRAWKKGRISLAMWKSDISAENYNDSAGIDLSGKRVSGKSWPDLVAE